MKIFGHLWIESKSINQIYSINDIQNSNANSIILLEPLDKSIELAKYCQKNHISYALNISSIKEAIFANELGASYIITSQEKATQIQPIAQNYLFDTEILAIIENEDDISQLAKDGIDGVVFANAIK